MIAAELKSIGVSFFDSGFIANRAILFSLIDFKWLGLSFNFFHECKRKSFHQIHLLYFRDGLHFCLPPLNELVCTLVVCGLVHFANVTNLITGKIFVTLLVWHIGG